MAHPRNDKSYFEKHLSNMDDPSKCWEWSGGYWVSGYGRLCWKLKSERAHRVSWMLYRGEIPQGLCVLHKCDNRKCVNPDHLFLGTKTDNMKDKVDKNRQSKGEMTKSAKITADIAKSIKKSSSTAKDLAAKYGITHGHVYKIKRGAGWRHANT